MLISHSHSFIYLKTVKTAGTSVEIAFESLCMPAHVGAAHYREEVVSEHGVVGARPRSATSTWWNHMTAEEIREKAGRDIWESYFKFACVRNPFDATVSMFWFEHRELTAELESLSFGDLRERFLEWVKVSRRLPTNRHILFDGEGALAIDAAIRYEHLEGDVAKVCEAVGAEWDPSRIARYKSEFRRSGRPFQDYFDREAAQIVSAKFAHYAGHFDYDMNWMP